MQMTRTGNMLMKHHSRMAGTYQIAYEAATPTGKKGTVLFVYEYDKRDVLCEQVMTTLEIADEMRAMLDDESPCCFDCFSWPSGDEENTNGDKVTEAIQKATILVYGWDG